MENSEVKNTIREKIVASANADNPDAVKAYADALSKIEDSDTSERDSKRKNTVAFATGTAGIVAGIWATLKSLKFEEKGVLTTFAGKASLNGLLKFKK